MAQQSALEKAADIFEKASEYIGALEAENTRFKQAQEEEFKTRTEKEAKELQNRLRQATGEDLDLEVAKKIASFEDEEVKALINKLASVEEVDTLGNARRKSAPETKVASVDEADEEFANWILNG